MAGRSEIQVDLAVKKTTGSPSWDQGTLFVPANPVHLREAYRGYSPRRVHERFMRKRIAIAALIGATVGAGWVMVLDSGHSPDSSLASAWNAIMWASCPSIGALRTAWWLVPLLNSIFYALIASLVVFVRKFIRPFAK
jgi:hypothetical protein